MWLVLCDPSDSAALWAYAGLRRAGLSPLELVYMRDLVCARSTVHRIGSHGATFDICLSDGRTLSSTHIRGMLNRLSHVPTDHLMLASEADADYAMQELTAWLLSWISCLGRRVINRPDPRGLAGAWRSAAEWTMLAARSGLPVPKMPMSDPIADGSPHMPATRTIIVLGNRIFGHRLPPETARACIRLARLADADLLGIDFALSDAAGVRFAGATPFPDLRLGGDAFMEQLHPYLTGLSPRQT